MRSLRWAVAAAIFGSGLSTAGCSGVPSYKLSAGDGGADGGLSTFERCPQPDSGYRHHVFITSESVRGDFGGSDALCARLGRRVFPAAIWSAYLWAAPDKPPFLRMTSNATGGWYSVPRRGDCDEHIIFPYRDALMYDGPREGGITITEDGDDIAAARPFAWTGGGKGGNIGSELLQCATWLSADLHVQGTIGNALDPSTWMKSGLSPCNETHHLYCVEQP